MEAFIWVMIGVAALAGVDRILGNKIGIGAELEKAVSMVMDGQITDAKTQIAILKAERILRGKN